MLTGISSVFANLWLTYGPDVITVVFWALVGVAVITPVMTIDSVYQAYKIGNGYSFRESYHSKRSQHKKDALSYGLLFVLVILCFFALII